MKLEHVALDVPDPEAFIGWWCANLGFRRAAPESVFILDDSGIMGIEVYRTKDTPAAPSYATMNSMTFHIAFVSDDVSSDTARLVAAGATFEKGSRNPDGFEVAFLRDPWGVSFQFCHRPKSIFLPPRAG